MSTLYTPKQLKRKFAEWSAKGLNFAVVLGLQKGIEPDRAAGVTRAPRKKGRLASTIRVTKPTLRNAVKTGLIKVLLMAGSRSKDNYVPQASVLQNGFIVSPRETVKGEPVKIAERTRAHTIRPRDGVSKGDWVVRVTPKGRYAGRQATEDRAQKRVLAFKSKTGEILFRKVVRHPGSKFKARKYLGLTVPHILRTLDAQIQASANGEIG